MAANDAGERDLDGWPVFGARCGMHERQKAPDAVVGPPRRTPTIGKMRSASKDAPDMVESAGDGRPRRG